MQDLYKNIQHDNNFDTDICKMFVSSYVFKILVLSWKTITLNKSRIEVLIKTDLKRCLSSIRRGIEKESLRTNRNGFIAESAHPSELGSPLTHKNITTDFSEALIELVTDCHESTSGVMQQLNDLHKITYASIQNELLWPNSMPCMLLKDSKIKIGNYGSSNIGMMKQIYRRGLSNRYGSYMQTISGIHYNFSLPDIFFSELQKTEARTHDLQSFKSDCYFGLIRNFHRFSWFLLYFLGASPVVSKNFLKSENHRLIPMRENADSFFSPHATSLRMGDLGYKSQAQDSLEIRYDSIETYISDLRSALALKYSDYEKIGVRGIDGEYKQLNTNLLQIENEFYSTIRPKRTTELGETPTQALENRGVEYVEIRCIDVNPFLPCGIDENTVHLLDIFLTYCLLSTSPPINDDEKQEIPINYLKTVYDGRDPSLMLSVSGKDVNLRDLAKTLINDMTPVADCLDIANKNTAYSSALLACEQRLENDSLLPAAKIISKIRDTGKSFQEITLKSAQDYSEHFAAMPMDQDLIGHYSNAALESIKKQNTLEQSDTLSFEEFVKLFS